MKKSMKFLRYLVIVMITGLFFTSCVKKDYDEPVTANLDPSLTVTHTIKQLGNLAPGSAPVAITTDVIVAGVVIADDASGNFYKTIIIQDSTAGLAILVDVSNFNTDYPLGRRVFVKCNGLYAAKINGNLTIGVLSAGTIGRIPAGLLAKYLVKGMWGLNVVPKLWNIADVIPSNTLVKFQSVEFRDGDNGVPYAVGSPPIRVITDCSSNTLDVYSSTYANFALTNTPAGNGYIVGVYTLYSGSGELQIRDLNDVSMNDIRCDGTNGQTVVMPIDSIRMLYSGTNTNAPTGKKIRATVISDYSTTMINGQNIYVQDATAGIQVRFTAAHSFAKGTILEINVSGQQISEFHGVLQLNNVPIGNVVAIGPGSVAPRATSIDQLNLNYNAWEATLVTVTGVTISGTPGVYSGSKIVTDGVNTITLFSSSTSTFANDSIKTGPVTITGILSEYDGTKEILIRNSTDVQ